MNQDLDRRFAIADHVSFKEGPGGLPLAEVVNSYATATIFLQGAQVTAFQPRNQEPVIWVSEHSFFEPDRSIRGGIPICWPWFADHPFDPAKPAHGFVRTAAWEVLDTAVTDAGATRIRFGIDDNDATRALWANAFELHYTVTIGPALRVELAARNTGGVPFDCTGALHTYFRVGEIGQTLIRGLEERDYLDKTDQFKRKHQEGPVTIVAETDRIYLDATGACLIEDQSLRRWIRIEKQGSRTTVVWNPWADKAAGMRDFGAQEYRQMVCVETANAADDTITLLPGETHRLTAVISAGEME